MGGERIGSLFSGVDGLALGLEQATGVETVWVCERDKDASAVLAERFPQVPNLGDIAAVRWEAVEPVDILCGGPPCQPTSSAGQRRGEADERWMWPAALDAVRRVRPRWVLFENPPAILTLDRGRPFGRILGALAEMGYVGRWGCLSAAEVGAPHRRERLFLFCGLTSYPDDGAVYGEWPRQESWRRTEAPPSDSGSARPQGQVPAESFGRFSAPRCSGSHAAGHGLHWPGRARGRRVGLVYGSPAATDAEGHEQRQQAEHHSGREPRHGVAWGNYGPAVRRWEAVHGPAPNPVDGRGRLNPPFVEWMMGFPKGWVTDCAISGSAQLRCLGNAVVPHVAEAAWRTLAAEGGPAR